MILSENNIRKIVRNILKEYLDKEVGKPIYDYLKNGERYSSAGYVYDSKKLIPLFCEYLKSKIPAEDLKHFNLACKNNPKLKNRIKIDYMGRLHCYTNTTQGFQETPSTDFFKSNASALYRIFAFNTDFAPIWENFCKFINTEEGNIFMSNRQNVDADVALMNPYMLKPQWLIHFTTTKEDALNICRNGFLYGASSANLNKMAYTNKNTSKEDKRDGNIGYAYNALEISDNFFPARTMPNSKIEFDNKFDAKTWERGMHFAVMFISSGVEASHLTDKENQVLFNTKLARDFVLLTFSWDQKTEPHEKDTRNKNNNLRGTFKWCVNTKDGDVIYSNASLTKAVRWVIANFRQYQKQICY